MGSLKHCYGLYLIGFSPHPHYRYVGIIIVLFLNLHFKSILIILLNMLDPLFEIMSKIP